MNRQDTIKKICCCPICHSSLSWEAEGACCKSCQKMFVRQGGKVYFTKVTDRLPAEVAFNFSVLEKKTPTSKMLDGLRKVITSQYRARDRIAEITDQSIDGKIVVECGSGNRRLSDNCINVDLIPFDNVDIVSDIMALPFENDSVDMIILDTVLEHVEDPQQCVGEASRVLKPGGEAFCVTPFIFPYHAYPKHYWNFSEDGMRHLFRNFSYCRVDVDMGPTSALLNLVSEYIALIFKGKYNKRYLLIKGLALLPLCFLRFVDYFWRNSENAKRIAMCLFTFAKK